MSQPTIHRRLSTPTLGLIWFGASVSLAEILTGTFFAPLGFEQGLTAILVGHIIGCILFWLVAAKTGASAMGAASRSFGHVGSNLFAVANVIQLVGWTAIMVVSGAAAANLLVPLLGEAGWCVVIGALIVFWIAIGVKRMGRAQSFAAVLLLVLTFVASSAVFGGTPITPSGDEGLSFGAAVELAVAMPLSWLPVVGDYTREAEKPVKASAVSAVVYGLVSCWMYVIGMGAAIFTGEYDISLVMVKAGLGVAGLLIVVFSTVTTTFLDAYSAGISSETVVPKASGKWIAVAVAVIGTVGAIVFPMDDITDFLYLIGSVFAPMIAIQIADYFFLHRDDTAKSVSLRNLIIWAIGFALYRLLMQVDLPVGNTLPDMLITALICCAANVILPKKA